MAAGVSLGGVDYGLSTSDGDRPGVRVLLAQPGAGQPVLGVYGDSYTAGPAWWAPGAGWATRVAQWTGALVVNRAVGGTGYVQDPEGRGSIEAQARLHPVRDADVLAVFGSINDHWTGAITPAEVGAAATATYAALRAAAPTARLLVVGPQWPATPPPTLLLQQRDAVRAAAQQAGALWLDASGWLAGRPDLIASDGVHANDDGQALLAERIAPSVRALLRA